MPTGTLELEALYRTTDRVRTAGLTATTSESLYRRYIEFVRTFAPTGRILDVGCGSGWSTYWFASKGYLATGVDLSSGAFEPPQIDHLRFVEGSATDLPFAPGTFEVVASYQCLEHVPDPRKALQEMIRVARPGGVVCIVGPNLLSLGQSALALTTYVWNNRPRRRILFRNAGMPHHPFGNTLPEAAWSLGRNTFLLGRKWLSRRASFTMREPDLRPPFHADNDAVYYCNPLDLTRFFRGCGCRVLRDTALGRSGWTRILAGGTWVAARTPRT